LKIQPDCIACILNRGVEEFKEATTNPAIRFRGMVELLRILGKKVKPTSIPAQLGTERDRLIKRFTGNLDPYKRLKQLSNHQALKLLPFAKTLINGYTQKERFKQASLLAIVGNEIEFNVRGHNFTFNNLRKKLKNAQKDLVIDDINEIYLLVNQFQTILYLTDNAGEIVFDTLLVEDLKNMGLKVIVGVKGAPVLNDATLTDAVDSGMDKIADKIITTGTDAVGFTRDEVSKEFLAVYNSVDMIIAKGMGYVETLTEIPLIKPHALLFRTKCACIADFFGVSQGKNVAKLLPERTSIKH